MGRFRDTKFSTLFIFTLLIMTLMTVQPAQGQTGVMDEPFFEVSFLLWGNNEVRIKYMTDISQEFEKIGIGVDIDIAETDLFFDRFFAQIEGVAPLYEEGGVDITAVAITEDFLDFMSQNHDSMFRSNDDTTNPETFNYHNSEFNKLHDEYKSEIDPAKHLIIEHKIFDLMYTDLPTIPIIQAAFQYMYNSQLNITETDLYKMTYGLAISTIADLNFNGKDTLNMTYHSVPWITTPFFDQSEHIVQSEGQIYKNLIFQGMYERDPGNFHEWVPMIAKEFPVWNTDHSVATITLRDDVYFADGVNLTSNDVVETYKTYLTPLPGIAGSTNNFHLAQYFTNDSIVALDDYTVQFTFTKPYVFPFDLLSKKILPIHIWGPHDNQTFPYPDGIPEFKIFDEDPELFNSTDRLSFGMGSGPYRFISANFAAGTETLTATDNYWKGTVQTKNLNFFADFSGASIFNRIKSGEIDLDLGGFYYDDELMDAEPTVSYFEYNYPAIHQIMLNFLHPQFGSGIDTPLGISDPSMASDAARYIRQAMSHIVPRQKISDELEGNIGYPAAVSVPNTVKGYNTNLVPHEYNIEKAKELMEMAGYVYPTEEVSSSISSSGTSKNNDSNYPFGLYLLLLPIISRFLFKKRK